MMYRVKQFFWAITAKLSKEEVAFVKRYLSHEELIWFNQLKVYERKHSIVLAKLMVETTRQDEKENIIRLGLLHDIGKIKYPIGPVRKSMMVLLHKFTKGNIAKCRKLKMVKCYYDHAEIGYNLLNQTGYYTDSFLKAIKNHHKDPSAVDSELLRLLRISDSQC